MGRRPQIRTQVIVFLIVVLAGAGLAGAPGRAAGPAPAPGGPAAPYNLQGDTNNPAGTSNTTFTSSGEWDFTSTGANSKAVSALCMNGANCMGVRGTASGFGVTGYAYSGGNSSVYGVYGTGGDTAASGTSYGGYFQSTNMAAGGKAYGLFATGITYGAYITSTNTAVYGKSTVSGTGVYGSSVGGVGVNGFSTDSTGVEGYSDNGNGVHGVSTNNAGIIGESTDYQGVIGNSATSSGVYGTSSTGRGVDGYSSSGDGVYGYSSSGTGINGYSSTGTGIKGISVSSTGARAASTNSYGVYASSTNYYGVYATTFTGTAALRAKIINPAAGKYAIIADGNVLVNGTLHATGGIVAPVDTVQGARLVYAEAFTTNLLGDQGVATLKDGRAVITLDPLYTQMVDLTDDYQVSVTPYAFDTVGLAVGNLTPTSFEVRELGKGHGSFKFSWRISAPRKGYAQQRLAPAPPMPAAPAPEEDLGTPSK